MIAYEARYDWLGSGRALARRREARCSTSSMSPTSNPKRRTPTN